MTARRYAVCVEEEGRFAKGISGPIVIGEGERRGSRCWGEEGSVLPLHAGAAVRDHGLEFRDRGGHGRGYEQILGVDGPVCRQHWPEGWRLDEVDLVRVDLDDLGRGEFVEAVDAERVVARGRRKGRVVGVEAKCVGLLGLVAERVKEGLGHRKHLPPLGGVAETALALDVVEALDPHVVVAPVLSAGEILAVGQMGEHGFVVGEASSAPESGTLELLGGAHAVVAVALDGGPGDKSIVGTVVLGRGSGAVVVVSLSPMRAEERRDTGDGGGRQDGPDIHARQLLLPGAARSGAGVAVQGRDGAERGGDPGAIGVVLHQRGIHGSFLGLHRGRWAKGKSGVRDGQ